MNFWSLFERNRLRPTWSITSETAIWRLMIDEEGRIVLEHRNQEAKTTTFSCADAASGRVLWKDRILHETWWIGMEALAGGVALFHGFAKPDSPEHKGLFAVDVTTGNLLWHSDEVTFWFAVDGNVYAYAASVTGMKVSTFNLLTGEEVNQIDRDSEDLDELRRRSERGQGQTRMVFASPLLPDTLPESVRTSVRREMGDGVSVGGEHYATTGDRVLVSFYIQKGKLPDGTPALQNRLIVVHAGTGNKLFEDVIARDAKAPVPDTFFVWDRTAVYVKDRTTLVGVRLWKS